MAAFYLVLVSRHEPLDVRREEYDVLRRMFLAWGFQTGVELSSIPRGADISTIGPGRSLIAKQPFRIIRGRAVLMFGGHSWDRTNDLPIKSRLLYQLSYMPNEKTLGWCPGPVFSFPDE